MARPYSEDLRARAVAAVEGGLSRHKAAALFSVGVSSVVRWCQSKKATGSVAAKPMGAPRRSRLDGEREWIVGRIEAEPSLTLEELRRELAERGALAGYGTVWRFVAKQKLTFKKNSARRRTGSP